jgi:predicted transcriptional regulator of viral defense system
VQNPPEVWLALPRSAWKPKFSGLRLRIVRFSGAALSEGVETHVVEGVSVRVTSVARTIADCFRYRNKLGREVALEALHEGWRKKRFTMDELWRFAELDRVTKVIMPYLETIPS